MPQMLSSSIASPMNDHFDLHYQDCAQRGIRFATAMLRNQSDAEEAVQEAFLRMHKSDSRAENPGYRGRFFRTLRNHCIDLIRRRHVRKEVVANSEIENWKRFSPCGMETEELAQAVGAALDSLPESWRNALFLKVHGQLSYDEIAEMTECTRNQVRTWIYRGRRQLEKELIAGGVLERVDGRTQI